MHDYAIPGTVFFVVHHFRESKGEDVTPVHGASPSGLPR